jgi:iron complex outermembrane recepter protein
VSESQSRFGTDLVRASVAAIVGAASIVAFSSQVVAAESAAKEELAEVIVTGSRIARPDYNANSPIVTVGDDVLRNSSTASVEVNLNKLPQFVSEKTPVLGGDIQATPTNTPGSATLSLRGIGSNRNLVLIDGRRATPGNAGMAVDVNTLPSAAIERVEIISGGASSTYGADAVGGVVNFILKKNFQGAEFSAQYGISERGDGQEYTISGLLGTNFAEGRGNISMAVAINDRSKSLRADRPWFKQQFADPTIGGNLFFPYYSGFAQTGANAAYQTILNNMFPNRTGNVSATASLYFLGNTPFTLGAASPSGLSGVSNFPANLIDQLGTKKDRNGGLSQNFLEDYLNLPLNRYNFYTRGKYDLTDWVSFVAQGYFNKTHTETVQQPGPIVGGWNVVIPRYRGGTDANGNALPNDANWLPANLVALLDARNAVPAFGPPITANSPWSVLGYVPGLGNRATITDVTTYNLVAGFEGRIPAINWTWDTTVSRGESNTDFLTTGVASLERLRAVMSAPNFGAGFVRQGNAAGGGFGANRATCTSGLQPFSGVAISADCIAAINADLKENAVMQQTVWEANAQGKVFDLPAGSVKAAIGATRRSNAYTFLEDTLKTRTSSFLDQALGIYPANDINATLTSKEFYGEISVPVLKDLPGIRLLELVGGARQSDSNVTGGSTTWKAELNWEVVDWLRVRASYNKAERSPNLGELYSLTQNFALLTGGDGCSTGNPFAYSAKPTNANGAAVKALCKALMDKSVIPGQPLNSDLYYGNGLPTTDPNYLAPSAGSISTSTAPGFAFPYFVGNPTLKAEDATTYTIGTVISSPFQSAYLSGLRLTLDYYNIKVDNAIGLQSGQTLQQLCLDKTFNPTFDPNTFFCNNFQRGTGGGIGSVQLAFTNTGAFRTNGLDVQLDWKLNLDETGLGVPGHFGMNLVFNRLLSLKSSPFFSGVPAASQTPFREYAGTLAAPDSGLSPNGAYGWKSLTNLSYSLSRYNVGLQWQHLPSIASGTTNSGASAYNLFALNGGASLSDKLQLRIGVENLFDKAPPITNVNPSPVGLGLPGGAVSANNYDILGRRFYIGFTAKF